MNILEKIMPLYPMTHGIDTRKRRKQITIKYIPSETHFSYPIADETKPGYELVALTPNSATFHRTKPF